MHYVDLQLQEQQPAFRTPTFLRQEDMIHPPKRFTFLQVRKDRMANVQRVNVHPNDVLLEASGITASAPVLVLPQLDPHVTRNTPQRTHDGTPESCRQLKPKRSDASARTAALQRQPEPPDAVEAHVRQIGGLINEVIRQHQHAKNKHEHIVKSMSRWLEQRDKAQAQLMFKMEMNAEERAANAEFMSGYQVPLIIAGRRRHPRNDTLLEGVYESDATLVDNAPSEHLPPLRRAADRSVERGGLPPNQPTYVSPLTVRKSTQSIEAAAARRVQALQENDARRLEKIDMIMQRKRRYEQQRAEILLRAEVARREAEKRRQAAAEYVRILEYIQREQLHRKIEEKDRLTEARIRALQQHAEHRRFPANHKLLGLDPRALH